MDDMYDYAIVGGGTAGCVLANRLSADPAKRVLLIEAGPPDASPFIKMPRGIAKVLADPRYVWPFSSRTAPGSNQPPAMWLRGKTLGGSSSVNGMMYVRGQPADFADLAAAAGEDWGWDHIARIYREIEDHPLGPGEGRGAGGPLRVSMPSRHPLMDRVIAAGAGAGLDPQSDINAPDNGAKIGYCPATIDKGCRQSAATAFLAPIRGRTNLSVVTGAVADRVVFSGNRAVAVEAAVAGKTRRFAGRRIILAAGTLASPAILQRSGIGPASLLGTLGIPLVADRAEVGTNLTEHFALAMQWKLRRPVSLNRQFSGWRLIVNALRYFTLRTGPLATPAYDVLGWFNAGNGDTRPDAQLIAAPFSIDKTRAVLAMDPYPGMQIAVYALRPRSRGNVEITSRDPEVLPQSTLDFLADPADRHTLIEGVRFVRRLVANSPISSLIEREARPGPAVQSDDEILEACRAMATTAYHAAGTCRMGRDPAAVTDPMTRVRGTEGLHVVDLSIFPVIPAGNTFAPVAAVAWRAAELIAGLPDADCPKMFERSAE